MTDNIKNKVLALNKKITPRTVLIIISIIIVVLLISSITYIYIKVDKMSKKIDSISNNLTMLQSDFSSTTTKLEGNISQTYSELTAQKTNVGDIANQLGSYQQEVGTITNTVNTLQKLSKTDPELLKKYSKVFFLSENYAPARLTEIPKDSSYSDGKALTIHTDVWSYLQRLLNDAKNAGVNLYVLSAFRSFDEQNALKGQYSVTYGAGTANQFSADQGYSEHQLGTTVDFMTTGIGGELSRFDGTPAYQWLTANAQKYGFTLSYPKDNPYYVYEPWHFRYVGVTLATELFNTGRHFYDMDQRTIDEYLISLF
jgi:LAS superfamily LD-carboxypeptidase LdcB